jgi:hypothetical protein
MTVKYNFKTEPYKPSTDCYGRLWRPNGIAFGFFMEMGTGKSKVLIDNIGTLSPKRGVKLRLGHRT